MCQEVLSGYGTVEGSRIYVMNVLFYLIYFVARAYITYSKYFNKMTEGTSTHILKLELGKCFCTESPKTIFLNKWQSWDFNISLFNSKKLNFYPALKLILKVFWKWITLHMFDLLFRRHSRIFINNVSISVVIKLLLARSSVWQALQNPLSRVDYHDLQSECGIIKT